MKHIYFVRPVGSEGPVKIGYSALPARRLSALMTWSPYPLEIVVTIPGTPALERNIHDCLADLHTHREWFRSDPRLSRLMQDLRDGTPIEQALDLTARVRSIRAGKGGVGSWDDLSKQRMSVLARVRHACNRRGWSNPYMDPPEVIREIVHASGDRVLAAHEIETIAQFARESVAPSREADAR